MQKTTTPVIAAPGISLYSGNGHAPFEAGRVVDLHQDVAEEMLASGHVINPPAKARTDEPTAAPGFVPHGEAGG